MRSGPRERKCEMRSGPIEKNMRGGSKERKCGRRFDREKMHFLDPFSATALGSTHPSPPICIVMFMKHWYKKVNWGNIMVWAN